MYSHVQAFIGFPLIWGKIYSLWHGLKGSCLCWLLQLQLSAFCLLDFILDPIPASLSLEFENIIPSSKALCYPFHFLSGKLLLLLKCQTDVLWETSLFLPGHWRPTWAPRASVLLFCLLSLDLQLFIDGKLREATMPSLLMTLPPMSNLVVK